MGAGELYDPGRQPSEGEQEDLESVVAEQALAEMRNVVRRLRWQLHDYLNGVPEVDDDGPAEQ